MASALESEPPGHAHSHGHSHGHSHDVIGWRAFGESRLLRAAVVFVALGAVATVVAGFMFWPSDEGTAAAVEQGAQVGLGSDRYAALVTGVSEGPCSYSTRSRQQECLTVEFQPTEGVFSGDSIEFQEFNLEFDAVTPDLQIGDKIVAGYEPSTGFWFYADRDRRSSLVFLGVLFASVVIALGRLRGLAALGGMALTVVVLIAFVAPSVLDGNDPLAVSVVAACAIAFVSLYLTHGFNPTTTVALAGTLVSLALTLALSSIFFAVARFTGLATEEALLLPFIAGDIDLSGLLMGGAVLGTLGALDDVTVTQVATVAELQHRSPHLAVRDLFASGVRVGRDHIASTVNTLLLAYVGASMPLLLLFAASDQPLDKVANSELISVEIVRTLCGSIGLVAAVPMTTLLAALVVANRAAADDDRGVAIQHGEEQLREPIERAGATHSKPVETGPQAPPLEPEAEAEEPAAWDDFAPDDTKPW